jgi:hypothetical protein
MYGPKRLAATLVAAAIVAVAAPAGASAATTTAQPATEVCFPDIVDLGPLGPYGPYGPRGPYGVDGPLHGQPNPLGDVATCGGFITYVLRGGTLTSFIQANIQAGQ